MKPGKPTSTGTMERALDRMGVAVTVHGFRSTFRDWAGDRTTFPRELAELALAHAVGDETEQAYRRSDALEKRRPLMKAWADYCAGERGKVVPLRQKGA
jgi:integrase